MADPASATGLRGVRAVTAAAVINPNPDRGGQSHVSEQHDGRSDPPETRQAQILGMLRTKSGVTIAALMKATGWQAHSVHGLLSAVVRRKLGLKLVSERRGNERVYRIAAAPLPRRSHPKAR